MPGTGLDDDAQLRLLDNFKLFSASDPSEYHPLESLDPAEASEGKVVSLSATGRLLDPDGGSKKLSVIKVTLPEVTEWCIDYGEPPSLWLLTKSAW